MIANRHGRTSPFLSHFLADENVSRPGCGIGWLYGAFIGAVVYMVRENTLSAVSPQFWQQPAPTPADRTGEAFD